MRTPNSLFRLRSETQITMAAGQNIPELGGYDFEFTSVVPDDFECPVCQLTMKDPIQIGGCGHRICNICLESLLRGHSPKCPVDRQPLSRDKIFPDVACHRKILDLKVKCSHVGCPWKGELRAVQKHQSECLFKVVECRNKGCKEKLTKRDMINHTITACVWRKVSCKYCRGSFIVKNEQQHHNVCQKFPVQCTKNCGLSNIPREKLLAHIRDDCPLTEIDCKYRNLGCQSAFPRTRTKTHLESHMESHLNLALCGLETTQNQVKDQSKQIERLTSIFNDQSQQIERLVAKITEQSKQIASLTFTVQGLVQHVERLGDTMKQGFKPKSINDIEEGMKVLFEFWGKKYRGTVRYVGPVPRLGNQLGIEIDPAEEVEFPPFCYSRHSGTYNGKRYFSCAPDRGCWVDFSRVIECYEDDNSNVAPDSLLPM
ncbi:unnamed protein product [Pocillopora meandrina]|uniref:Uncharacterized protein n=1 Tax=Pocillopora meandrina TaxID=46732 RepID=A0AAU9XZ09_9CNID|nr:unnamed protein product [Pocillopora meandrina]